MYLDHIHDPCVKELRDLVAQLLDVGIVVARCHINCVVTPNCRHFYNHSQSTYHAAFPSNVGREAGETRPVAKVQVHAAGADERPQSSIEEVASEQLGFELASSAPIAHADSRRAKSQVVRRKRLWGGRDPGNLRDR